MTPSTRTIKPHLVGESIRWQRELAELSMRQVAEMAGISNPYPAQDRWGLRESSEQVLAAVARSLQLFSRHHHLRGTEPIELSATKHDDRRRLDLTSSQRGTLTEADQATRGFAMSRRR